METTHHIITGTKVGFVPKLGAGVQHVFNHCTLHNVSPNFPCRQPPWWLGTMPHATESQSLGMFQTVPHPMPQQGQDSGEAAITLPETRASIPVRASGISAAQMAKIFPTDLNVAEKMWRDRYRFFKDQHGLSLRPRYHPDWRPSWIAEEHDPSYCEDAIAQIVCWSFSGSFLHPTPTT